MFRKIVSQLSFSPALVGQLSFYAKRLKKEQTTRRLGLVFVALALVVQSLAVFQPPQSANAANANDMIPGGLGYGSSRTLDNFVGPYDRNERNLKDVMNYFGISRNEIAAAQFTHFTVGNKIVWGYENRAGATGVPITNGSGAQVTSLYGRPLQTNNAANSEIYGYVGYSSKVGWFAIMQVCGNLVTDVYPSPPPPPPAPTPPPPPAPTPANITVSKTATNVSQNNVDATKVTAKENQKITFKLTAKNTGGTAKDVTFSDILTSTLRFSKLIDNGGGSFNSSSDVLSWPAVSVAPGATITKSFSVQMNSSLETTETNCKMVNSFTSSSTVTIPVNCTLPPANITLSKTATNVSQNNVDATKVTAKVGQKITFKLTAKNTGGTAKSIDFSDNLTSALTFSKLTDNGGGSFNAASKVLSWPAVSVAPGATVTKTFTIQMNSSLETTQTNCKIMNSFADSNTVIIPVACTPPPANIILSKTATNVTQNNVDASKVSAKVDQKITFKLVAKNTGGTAKSVTFSDNLTSTLRFATIANDGGGTLDTKTKVLTWPAVSVAPGATVTKSFTVQMNSSLENAETNCKIVNSFSSSSTVTVPVNCTLPPAEIVLSKSAKNVSQGNINATTKVAKAKDQIIFTLVAENKGGSPKTVTFEDMIGDTLEYSKLTDNGGGTYKESTRTLAWPAVELKAGAKEIRTFTVQILAEIPATPTGLSDPSSYDCRIENVFGTDVIIDVTCPGPKVIEQIVPELPHTGASENMIFAGIVLSIVTFFYFRSKQLSTEVRLIRRDLNGGTI